jgi:hypothetical protein
MKEWDEFEKSVIVDIEIMSNRYEHRYGFWPRALARATLQMLRRRAPANFTDALSINVFKKLGKLQTGTCNCGAKPDELEYHKDTCIYRLASEIEDLLLPRFLNHQLNWQTTDTGENQIPCHSLMLGGVLCRWWGDKNSIIPSGVELIDTLLNEPKVDNHESEKA